MSVLEEQCEKIHIDSKSKSFEPALGTENNFCFDEDKFAYFR